MIAYLLAVFLLGALCSGPVWTQMALKENERRAKRDLRKLARRR